MIRIWNVLQGHGKYLLCCIILAAVLAVTNPVCDDLLTNSHEIRSLWASHIHDAEICWACFEMSGMGAELSAETLCFQQMFLFGLKVSQSVFNLETHPIYRQISWEILKLLVTISYFLKCWLPACGRALDWARINPVIKPWQWMMEPDILVTSPHYHLSSTASDHWPRKCLNLMTKHARNIGCLSLQFPPVTLICWDVM